MQRFPLIKKDFSLRKYKNESVRDFLRYFPKKPYEHQMKVMERIESALRDGKIVLFEGGCGTGKTLISLATSISIAKEMNKKVLIATNVHQQMLQFMVELREIKKREGDIKVCVLKGKMHLCPEKKSYEECEELKKGDERRGEICKRYLKSSEVKMEEFKKWYFSDVRAPEEVAEREKDVCAYELIKRCMSESDVILCNYHHILNLEILVNLLNWCSCDLRDLIVIFDEAHNLENSAREHASLFLHRDLVKRAIDEAEKMEREDFSEFIKRFDSIILELIEEGSKEDIWIDSRGKEDFEEMFLEEGNEIAMMIEKDCPNAMEILEEIYEVSFDDGENLRVFSDFLMNYLHVSVDPSYAFAIHWRRGEEMEYFLEIFSCIPKNVTKPLFDSIFASVLMSATLRPFEVLKRVLGIERATLEIVSPTPFPRERRITLVVKTPPLFQKRRDKERIIRTIRSVLRDAIRFSSGNVLIFFQSYQEAEKYYKMMEIENKLLDRVGESSEEIRRRFFELGERGKKAVLFTYLWGTLTEGIDYRNERARTVVIVGVGYPSLNKRIMAIKKAYDHHFGNGWEYAIQIPTIRRIRQCMGRVVRSPEDYGARILVDVRFSSVALRTIPKYEVYSRFPEDEREEFVEISPEELAEKLSKFFSGFFHSASEFRRLDLT